MVSNYAWEDNNYAKNCVVCTKCGLGFNPKIFTNGCPRCSKPEVVIA